MRLTQTLHVLISTHGHPVQWMLHGGGAQQTCVRTLCGLLPRTVAGDKLRRRLEERHVAREAQVQHMRRSELPAHGAEPHGPNATNAFG